MKYFSGLLYLPLTLVLFCSLASAQSITLTGPSSAISVQEGDDFATEQLGNPWDMNQLRDFGWDQNFGAASINVSNGVWSGANETPGGYLFPLFPGFKGLLSSDRLPGNTQLPGFGINHRINTQKYTLLSYRSNHTNRATLAVYWEDDDTRVQYWPDPESPRGASYDGYYHYAVPYLHQGWHVYSFDMTNLNSSFAQVQGSWSGSVYALRLDPSVTGGVGATTQFDWVRLVDPNSAPYLNISWNSRNLSQFYIITVYLDSDNSGYDGSPIARFTDGNDPGSYNLPTAMLPPGNHYFYVTAQEAFPGGALGALHRSGYSARLTINAKPSGHFTSPTQATGTDYATSELNNPWDMDSAVDVPNLNTALFPDVWRQFTQASFAPNAEAEQAGKVFQALADAPWSHIGNNESDVQVHMNVPAATPINPSRYRYLTYRLAVDPSLYPTIHDKVQRGWVSRQVFWNTNVITDGGSTLAHIVYEGWNTYTIDLWDESYTDHGIPWEHFQRIDHFRIDPLETDVPTWFYLDWAKLTTENYISNNTFNISFDIADTDSLYLNAELYYDTDDSGYNGTHIATLTGLSAGSHSHSWNTAGVADGSYFLYLVLSDGVNTSRVYAPVRVIVGDTPPDPEPRSEPPAMDYDGDGVSDHCVYRASSGVYYQNRSTTGFWAMLWGGAGFQAIHGDFDGDNKADTGLVIDLGGYYWWYIIRSSDGILYSRMWGMPGDQFVIADYNGNGRDEIAVFRAGSWYVLDESDAVQVHYWGQAGDFAVPRDYDGDGIADVAIWRPADGMWWILNSGFQQGHADDYYSAIQWGLPGDIPVAADWTQDGKADPAVFRPSVGMWYVRDIVTGATSATQWGLPGDVPIVGDYNGDGNLDFTVYRDYLGMWYHNYRNGSTGTQQFGLPGDLLPIKAN